MPLKIAFIVGGFPKISETFILSQITGLLDLGHDVDIYANRRLHEPAVHSEVHTYRLLDRTHCFDLPSPRLARLRRAAPIALRLLPRHFRAMARCLDPRHHRSAYALLNNVMRVEPFLRRHYDAVMCHFGTNGIDYIFLKDIFPHLKFFTMFHSGDILLGDEEGAGVYARLAERGDLFLAISDSYNRRKLVEFGFDKNRIVTHRIGVAVGAIPFAIREPAGAEFRILTVARLDPEKGLDYGIRAVAELIGKNPGRRITYRIIGDGVRREALHALIAELGLANHVSLLGPKPTKAVIEHMLDSHAFLLPSLAEGTPTVLLEAQATGLPVIATDVGGVRDIVRDGVAGFVVPARDVWALVARLQHLLDSPESWARLGEAGRQFVERHHEITGLNRRLAQLFEDLVRGVAPTTEHGIAG